MSFVHGENSDHINVVIKGSKHFESIEVFLNGKEIDFPQKESILQMRRTFAFSEMYDLMDILTDFPAEKCTAGKQLTCFQVERDNQRVNEINGGLFRTYLLEFGQTTI